MDTAPHAILEHLKRVRSLVKQRHTLIAGTELDLLIAQLEREVPKGA